MCSGAIYSTTDKKNPNNTNEDNIIHIIYWKAISELNTSRLHVRRKKN